MFVSRHDSIPHPEIEPECCRDMTEVNIDPDRVRLETSWRRCLGGEFSKPYMLELKRFLLAERRAGRVIHPPPDRWFRAFDLTPLDQTRVVLLGQAPYHGPGQAQGLCFSVPRGVAIPPSLVNVFAELEADLGVPVSRHGCLEHWARQGVLLLNSVLTVTQGQAGSHQQRGWERFTDEAIRCLDEQREGLVFLLWGGHARKKGRLIDRERHCVLQAPHPSPLSAYRGFFGCRHFSTANAWLERRGLAPIDWALPQ